MSKNTYGVIECNDAFYDSFSDIPRDVFFKICIQLSGRLYIDYDYIDEATLSFDKIYILPQAYNCIETQKTNRINMVLAITAIIVAIIMPIILLLLE